jgi:GNAT superfamily N-acetyltransferase
MNIRKATIHDIDTLFYLIKELAAYEKQELILTKDILIKEGFGDSPRFQALLGEIEGKTVGYALFFYTFSTYQGKPVLYLEDLYVQPSYQNRGLGSQLLKTLENEALKKGCCRLEWHVYDWNKPAIDYYLSQGAELQKSLIKVTKKGSVVISNSDPLDTFVS